MTLFKRLRPALSLMVGLATASVAQATVYNLNMSPVADLAGQIGTVQLTQMGTNEVDVLVSLGSGYEFVKTGGPHDAFTFNLNTNHVYSITGISQPGYSAFNSGSNPSFGSFSNSLDCSQCKNGGKGAFASSLAFKVSAPTGISISNFSANAQHYLFSADVIKLSTGTTGAVGAMGLAAPVPEPQTYALMLAGLGAIGFIARRRSNNKA